MNSEEEARPPVVYITASNTEEEISGKKGEEQRGAPDKQTGNAQNPEKATCSIKATRKWKIDENLKKPIKRTSERVQMPTKRYWIDLIQLDTESEN